MAHTKSSSASRLKHARECVVTGFADHWRRVLRSRKDIAKERADCFFAGNPATQLRLARSFYGREHAHLMAKLSTAEIREMLSPWLEHALRHWQEWDLADSYLAKIATAEYVSIIDRSCHGHIPLPGFSGAPMVDRYPSNEVVYDDLYERLMSGFSCGGVLRIYKSTGERFTPFEARSARAGIRRDLLGGMASAGDDDPWDFNMNAEECWEISAFAGEDLNRVIVVEVNDFGGAIEDELI